MIFQAALLAAVQWRYVKQMARSRALAFRAARQLPPRGSRVVLTMARVHENNPAFQQLCRKLL